MKAIVRFQFLILLVAIVSFAAFAFASSRTGPRAGGEGVGAVSGWNVSGIHYALAEGTALVSSVEFDLDKPAKMVRVSLLTGKGGFFDCVNLSGRHWMCDVESHWSVADLDQFRVIAVGGAD